LSATGIHLGAFDPPVLCQDLDVIDLAAIDVAGLCRQDLPLVLLTRLRYGLVKADAAIANMIALRNQQGRMMKRNGHYRPGDQ